MLWSRFPDKRCTDRTAADETLYDALTRCSSRWSAALRGSSAAELGRPAPDGRVSARVEEEYAAVLLGIETAVVSVACETPDLVDKNVLAAVDALIALYSTEIRRGRRSRAAPTGRSGVVYERCLLACEWQLGRGDGDIGEAPVGGRWRDEAELTVYELVRCLKRLRKSIRLWHKQGGRRGYLSYVRGFIDEVGGRGGT